MIRRLILLRHGQTDYNATDRMQGQLDTDLSELGRSQAKTAAAELAVRAPIRIVSSDLKRALDTAEALGDAAGVPVSTDERLRETHLGDWQGLTHTEVDDIAPGARPAWRADATVAPPGGESRIDVANRSVPLVRELLGGVPEWGADGYDCIPTTFMRTLRAAMVTPASPFSSSWTMNAVSLWRVLISDAHWMRP